MKFSEFTYERPNYEEIKKNYNHLVEQINNANTYEEQFALIKEVNAIRNDISTMGTLASIRNSINKDDEFYDKENEYWDEYSPLFSELDNSFYKALVNSKFKVELTKELGKQFLSIAEYSLKSFSPEIIGDMQEENKLSSEYSKLVASAKIEFDGKELNLSGLRPYMLSEDRAVRQSANDAYFGFFTEHEDEFDTIYDSLVKVRDRMAKKLGFNNFVELGYIRMMRTDYNAEMVKGFRKQVLEHIVPSANKLYERQAARIGVDKLAYFDESFEFLTGNAAPKGDAKFILENGMKMYSELSPETKEFFEFMVEGELLDLETKKGKQAGGYCTYIPNYKAPFIFSNFNTTSDDIDVLTHEAGHAFQVYRSRWIEIPDINFPTYESCEIHSMSMEFITWPWMELFFKEETDKYKFAHLGGAIKFIPYGITVDEFQHFVYENPTATKEERKAAWRNLEKQYLPHKNYEGCDLLERGGWWLKQAHIFNSPFYYIDYTLAQICALQFWKRIREDKETTWQDYLNLCSVGGTKSFLELVDYANLKSPFEEGCVSSIIGNINDWLDAVEDKSL